MWAMLIANEGKKNKSRPSQVDSIHDQSQSSVGRLLTIQRHQKLTENFWDFTDPQGWVDTPVNGTLVACYWSQEKHIFPSNDGSFWWE